MKNNWCYTLQ